MKRSLTRCSHQKLTVEAEKSTDKEFDVWTDDDGHMTATRAESQFVYDLDAPYGYSRHQIRVVATGRRSAMVQCRRITRNGVLHD